jgi:hypothetical protein
LPQFECEDARIIHVEVRWRWNHPEEVPAVRVLDLAGVCVFVGDRYDVEPGHAVCDPSLGPDIDNINAISADQEEIDACAVRGGP